LLRFLVPVGLVLVLVLNFIEVLIALLLLSHPTHSCLVGVPLFDISQAEDLKPKRGYSQANLVPMGHSVLMGDAPAAPRLDHDALVAA